MIIHDCILMPYNVFHKDVYLTLIDYLFQLLTIITLCYYDVLIMYISKQLFPGYEFSLATE